VGDPIIDPTSEVWNRSRSSGTERVVLLAIAKHADADGYAWPGLALLVQMANVSERATQAAIAKLLDSGELAVLRGRGRGHASLYRVFLGQPAGAGDPAVMVAWLRGKTTPFLADLYGQITSGKVKHAAPFDSERVKQTTPISVGKGEADDTVTTRNGEAERPEKVKLSAVQPGAIRNELPEEDREPPTVVAAEAAPTNGDGLREPVGNGHGELIPLRSARAAVAVNGVFERLKAEVDAGRRSWSWTEAAKAEWDALLDDDRNLEGARQFLMWVIAEMRGHAVTTEAMTEAEKAAWRHDWAMCRQKVLRHRALALYGIDQALTRGLEGQAFWNYVEAVCRGTRARIAGGDGQ
jgi:hypothetical protein